MPSRATRTEKGQGSDQVEYTGPSDGGSVDTDAGGSSAWIARPASRVRQKNGISLVSTQVGTRGRSNSVPAPKAFSNGTVKTGQISLNDIAHINTTTTTLTPRQRTRSPEDWRHSTGQLLICVPEDAEMSVDQMRATRSSENSRARGVSIPRMTQTYYGATPVTGYPASLEIDNEDELSEEEEECLLDEELARSGLFRGNYKNTILLYTFVPLTTLFAFIILAFLPVFAFHSATPSSFPYPPYFPYPLPELITAAALWSLSHLLRDILYETSSSLVSWIPIPSRRFPNFIPFLTSVLAAILQNTSAIVLRQLAVPILLIPLYSTERPLVDDGGLYTAHHNFPTWEDVAFKRVWWVALGWAAAEAVVGIKQGYENIALYKDVLVNVRKTINEETPATSHPISSTDVTAGIGQAGTSGRQKSSESRRPLSDREAQNTGEFSRRRDYSSSLSSIASGPYDDLPASATHERQPLLTLRHQPADNFASGMGSGAVAEDADRELVESIVEQDLQELMCLKSREEVEELYGMPVIRIPVFISCLHRINSILASLAVCLILTAAYMRSTFAYDYSHQARSSSESRYLQLFFPPSPTFHPAIQSSHPLSGSSIIRHPFSPSDNALIISFTVLLGVETIFSVLHAPWVLPRIGVHTYVYLSLLVWLGLFFSALGFWEALS